MNPADIQLAIVEGDRAFEPGDLLVGSFAIPCADDWGVRSAELSILWRTAGKGDEDIGVHRLFTYSAEGSDAVSLARKREFRTRLPAGPLTYDGVVVRIEWCVRLRIFMPRGKQRVFEQRFRLGSVRAGQRAAAAVAESIETEAEA